MASPLILKERKLGLEKRIIVISFREKYPSAKEPMGLHDIIIVASRHVEAIILMTRSGSGDKK